MKIPDSIKNLLIKYKTPIAVVVVGILSVVCLVIAFNSFGKNYVSEIIDDLVQNQIQKIEKNYKDELEKRDIMIKDLNSRITKSEQTFNKLNKRVDNVEKRIKNRKPPVNSGDLRDRFNNAGYPPTN